MYGFSSVHLKDVEDDCLSLLLGKPSQTNPVEQRLAQAAAVLTTHALARAVPGIPQGPSWLCPSCILCHLRAVPIPMSLCGGTTDCHRAWDSLQSFRYLCCQVDL